MIPPFGLFIFVNHRLSKPIHSRELYKTDEMRPVCIIAFSYLKQKESRTVNRPSDYYEMAFIKVLLIAAMACVFVDASGKITSLILMTSSSNEIFQ